MADQTPGLMRVRPDDPKYIRMAQAEAAYWTGSRGVLDGSSEGAPPLMRSYYNRRFTDDPATPWFETLQRHGEFHEGLVLGGGGVEQEARILELNPTLCVTVTDISEGALARRQQDLAPRFPGRVKTLQADFNFVELAPDTYDIIISASAIHHIINLEHLAIQINLALRPSGMFFLNDYVGESFRRFSAPKKLAYEAVYNRDLMRQGRLPTTLAWTTGDDRSSPFCGIRSGDVLDVLRAHLHEQEVRTAAALWFPLFFARDVRPLPPIPLHWRLLNLPGVRKLTRIVRGPSGSASAFFRDDFLRDLQDVGDRLTDAGEISPSNAFAIYRKRPSGR